MGKKEMARIVDNTQKREMVRIVDNTKGREMCTWDKNRYQQELEDPNSLINRIEHRKLAGSASSKSDFGSQVVTQTICSSRIAYDSMGEMYFDGVKIMNARVIITAVDVFSKSERYNVSVMTATRKIERKILVRDFRKGEWIKELHGVRIYDGVTNELLRKVFAEIMNSYEGIQVLEVVDHQGWHIDTVNDVYTYITKMGLLGTNRNLKTTKGKLMIPERLDEVAKGQAVREFYDMRYLTSGNTAKILQIYLVQSLMFEIYRIANAVPKYSLFVVGKRGTGKTSVAVALTQSSQISTPPVSFRATTAGIESVFADYANAVLLVDDLCPVAEARARTKMEEKLEVITRLAGDASGKERCLDFLPEGKEVSQYKCNGGVVFTGELISGTAAQSSLARMLIISLDRERVDWNRLSFIQNNRVIFDATVAEFIGYIAVRGKDVVEEINREVHARRAVYNGLYSNVRYGEYRAQLEVAAMFWVRFLGVSNAICPSMKSECLKEYTNCIELLIQENSEMLAVEHSPALNIIKAILYSEENGDTGVFRDKNRLCFKLAHLQGMFAKYNDAYGYKGCAYTAHEMLAILKGEGLLERRVEGRDERYTIRVPGHGRERYVALLLEEVKKRFEGVLEE